MDEPIVAIACNVCQMSVEVRGLDADGNRVGPPVVLDTCPACGSEDVDQLTAAQLKEQYED